jgi:hypothetical protein
VAVAVKGHYSLMYRPYRTRGPIVQTGRIGSGHVKHALAGVITIIHTAVPACFQQYARSIHSFASSGQ